jgi:hypothetical protein
MEKISTKIKRHEIKTKAIELFKRSLNPIKIQENLIKEFGKTVTEQTILKWIKEELERRELEYQHMRKLIPKIKSRVIEIYRERPLACYKIQEILLAEFSRTISEETIADFIMNHFDLNSLSKGKFKREAKKSYERPYFYLHEEQLEWWEH